MGITELFLIAVGLSMDAFAVSVCKGTVDPVAKASALPCRRRVVRRISGVNALNRLPFRLVLREIHHPLRPLDSLYSFSIYRRKYAKRGIF